MFFEFGIKDFIDILLVAFLLYYTYKLMKASGSINVFTGILVFILIWLVVSQVLEMKLLGSRPEPRRLAFPSESDGVSRRMRGDISMAENLETAEAVNILNDERARRLADRAALYAAGVSALAGSI